METPFGFHHPARRKTPCASGSRLHLEQAGTALDSIYMDSLAEASNIELKGGAAATMRAAGGTEAARRSRRRS